MMKRLLLAALFCLLSMPAFALTCTNVSPQLKDNAGTTFNAPYVDDTTGSGDCQPKLAQGLPGAAAAAWYMQMIQGGAVLSATNGIYSNILQGNAALSTSNGLPATIVQGGNTMGVDSNGNGKVIAQGVSPGTAVAGITGSVVQADPVSSAPTYSAGLANWLTMDLSGRLWETNIGIGSTGSAPPSGAQYMGASSGGNLTGMVACNSHAFLHITSATDTQIVGLVSSQIVKICGYKASFSGSAAQSIYLEYGTGSNCVTGTTQMTGVDTGNSSAPSTVGFYNSYWGGLANIASNEVCVHSTGTGGVDVDLWYTQGS